MSTPADTDIYLVNRGGSSYTITQEDIMAELQDTDLLLVDRSGTSYKITGADFKASIERPPVVGSATLSEDDATGDRFTSEDFTVAITMSDVGNPVSDKELKGYVEGTLELFPVTDTITNVTSGTAHSAWATASATAANAWTSIAYGGSKFVAVSQDGTNRAMYSTDGTSWTAATGAASVDWRAVTYGNGKFVAISTDTTYPAMYSTNGTSWTSATSGQEGNWISVTYGNGKFVAVSYGGDDRVMYSSDGNSWTPATPPLYGWFSVTYGNGKFVAVAYGGESMYSSDGINWSLGSGTAANYWMSVTYGGGKFVAVSNNGTNRVMYSTNGTSWTSASAAEANYWFAVTYADSKFVAVSRDGTNRVMWSTDGITWNAASAAEANSWMSITYGDSKFVSIASDGTNRVMWSASGTGVITSNTLTFTTDTGLTDFSSVGSVVSEPSGATGVISSIDVGNKQMVLSPYTGTWTASTGMKAKAATGASYSKLYTVLAANGQVSDLVAADPGYTTMTGNPDYTLTFPATFTSGDAPDTALPSGTSFTVDVKATNTQGSSLTTTNTLTPS